MLTFIWDYLYEFSLSKISDIFELQNEFWLTQCFVACGCSTFDLGTARPALLEHSVRLCPQQHWQTLCQAPCCTLLVRSCSLCLIEPGCKEQKHDVLVLPDVVSYCIYCSQITFPYSLLPCTCFALFIPWPSPAWPVLCFSLYRFL